ncbi:DUF1275 domain-containing protein [Brucella pseudogrignonensis]|jgi:uncharacterized membrane protein YoaK (UPF0700 family)|uniref:YoaK family protein n=1 Tax=Brucella pseudogrignonensis TaxID=419475 RepID=UPI000CFC4D7B|nr:YoaK family protein [Brucella pseudogrignonensis]MBK0023485.1 DUF1275 domain-containing protein [Ochrobactrum sp. S45]MBK0045145.1 DUF1275 domain-containing protein [Ochrobactrum sp. S46]MQP42207.1 DUF1275 domain-containing protein [Ochrobactrum sp. MYb237]MCD4513116.1 DUF1275 domain-containing protein [Brucella pseudogrignonensis]PQZ44197.1 DUF1275 family protein [Brucella pseudogrignonensis]
MTPNSQLSLGLALTASAGFVDAIAFLELGGFFASFMSGNTTQLGIAIAGQPDVMGNVVIWLPAALIALFFVGAFLGTLAVRAYRKDGSLAVMASVVIVLLLVSILRREGLALVHPVLLLAAAMGAQNAAVQPIGSARLGVTYVTGTLFNSAADLAGSLRGEVPRWRWLQHFAVWFSLMVGAVCGGLAHYFIGLDALFIPAIMIVVVMVIYWKAR